MAECLRNSGKRTRATEVSTLYFLKRRARGKRAVRA